MLLLADADLKTLILLVNHLTVDTPDDEKIRVADLALERRSRLTHTCLIGNRFLELTNKCCENNIGIYLSIGFIFLSKQTFNSQLRSRDRVLQLRFHLTDLLEL